MSIKENRDIVIERVRKEIIGAGSDIFQCKEDFSDEIIEGKPLQRYFSGILFPKQLQPNASDNGEQEMKDEDADDITDLSSDAVEDENKPKEVFEEDEDETDKTDTQPKYTSNTFFPSHFGITFAVENTCEKFKAIIRFGNYIKAKPEEIKIPYSGEGVNLLSEHGLNGVVSFDEEKKTLSQTKKLQRTKDGKPTAEYQAFQDGLRAFAKATSYDHALYKTISKLFFKDKYKRNDNKIEFEINIADILSAENQHIELKLSEQANVNTENWSKEMKENLVFHLKLYTDYADKYYIKAVIENKSLIAKDKFSLSKEKVNQLACFQTEIRVESEKLLPFRDYKAHLYKTDEDRMLDYLYRDKLAFGIGHNTACTWENAQSPNTPQWIQSTFLPEYDVKSQSSETDKIKGDILNIKKLSVYNSDKTSIISNLNQVAEAYKNWIEEERKSANGNELGLKNIAKCEQIYNRISNGIKLLSENEKALRAFQLANTAIYLQMFQTAQHFSKKKEGFEVWERNEVLQHNFDDYANLDFPSNRIPEWRPFQLAFILQCLASFVDENSTEKELIDLLYFPTGGGKTEAYLAVSAFLIFWRRINYSDSYDGVNIIIRYTLRLLSAQQFERASKMILACEFIRNHYNDLGDKPVSIGFWVGNQTIPNTLKEAETKLKKAQEKLNKGDNYVVNPFQLSNCQWCNTKIISKLTQTDKIIQIGHRVGKTNLQSHCLNEVCHFSEKNGGLPIVLIDEDIYKKPPTILFATVDKFAMLAWKGEATTFFNNGTNRKPELIIQDELHLLNGTLGSLVGLFENALLKLCDNPKIIASTATVKNVDKQIQGLYGREARVFPQYATNADDTFFSKVIEESKRKYIGILPTGKTTVVTNLQLLASLLFARLEIWKNATDKKEADSFWTILSYFKSLKEIGRFSNKINSELKPIIKQLQVRYLNDDFISANNYNKLSYRNIELTSRIPNEKIKKNLDLLEREFDGDIKEHTAYDLVLATNMISVGLDVGRLGVMVMNGMPPNTAEYIQASSRVARKNEGLVITLYDPFNSRDLSYYEDFVQFHKTFYKQVEPLSVTPFAENALDKMLFTLVLAYFRHTTKYTANEMATGLIENNVKEELLSNLITLFQNHQFAQNDIQLITEKLDDILRDWKYKIEAQKDLKYYWKDHPKESLIVPMQEKKNDDDILTAMQSMRRPKASYFPKWFYCTRCNRFANYSEWKRRWTASGKKTDFFNPPKCSNRDCKENNLEQIRFVMTCNNGHIHDLPWKFWNNRLPTDRSQQNDEENENTNEKSSGPQLDFSKPCCESQDLIYKISRENTELSGIWVECKSCKKKANLKGIFNFEQACLGKKYWLKPDNGKFHEEICNAKTSVKLKTSNSVYYANSLGSLYIPEMQNPLSTEIRIDIDNMVESGQFTTEQIVQLVSIQKKIDKELIEQYLEIGDIKYIPDNIYRETEYKYFLEKEQPDNKQIKFRVIDCSEQIHGFSKLVKIDKLKRTTVQTSFTRNEPIDVDSILQNSNDYKYTVQRQSVSKNNFETKTLPALESFGEGILFVLDEQKLKQWEQQQEVIERTEKIKSNAENADWKSHQIIAKSLTPRKVLIHTLSHLLMRELEYVCGYPASSLSERLFVSETMYGFLISAFDGTDGYLGGLSNLCNDLENLNNIINSAIFRATDCSSDPICIESEGQGVGQLNLAACHSCTLTPETTCELSNLYLDRKLVISNDYGYFKSVIE